MTRVYGRRKRIGKRVVVGGNITGASHVVWRRGKGILWVFVIIIAVWTLCIIEMTVLETEVFKGVRMFCAGWWWSVQIIVAVGTITVCRYGMIIHRANDRRR